MKSKRFHASRRFPALICGALALAWLATGCGNNGSVGDGVIDDSNGPPVGGALGSGGSSGAGGAAIVHSGKGASGASGKGGQGGSAGASGGGAGMGGGASGAAGSAGSGGGGTGGSATGGGGTTGSAGTGGSNAGTGGGGGTVNLNCGNGVVDTGEQCDEGTGPATTGEAGAAPAITDTCSNTCQKIATQACVDCENAGDCFESVENCLGPPATPFTPAQQTQCYAVMHCIESSNCLDGTGSLGVCYCGALSTAACGAAPFTGPGSPTGACVAEIKAGMPGLNTNSLILGALTAKGLPAGAGMQRLNCQKIANTSACIGPCGLTTGGPAYP